MKMRVMLHELRERLTGADPVSLAVARNAAVSQDLRQVMRLHGEAIAGALCSCGGRLDRVADDLDARARASRRIA